VKDGQRVIHNKGTGAMGLGVAAAIGACLGGGGRRTICVEGDGSFHMSCQELETVRRLNLPIKFFVLNNQGYASIRASQQNYFGRLTGADASSGLTLPDTIRIAEAHGVATARISESTNLPEQVRKVLATPGPVVCEVAVIPDEPRIPYVKAMQRPDGTIVSMPLEDMYPYLDRYEFRANMIVPTLDE
jgi:acetolactate synthase-1/2/3 large subunit